MPEKSKIFYGWWVAGACFLMSVYIGAVVFWGVTAFFEPLVAEFGWSYTEISFAASLRGLEMGILSPLVGVLVDRFGSRKLMTIGAIIVGAALLLLSRTQSLITFYIAFIMLSFGGGGCTSVVIVVVIASWFKKNLGRALGVTASGFGASGLLLPVIVKLIDVYGWRTTYLILGVGVWLVCLPMCWIIRNDPESMGLRVDGETEPVDQGDDKDRPRPAPAADVNIGFRSAWRLPAFWAMMFLEFMRAMTSGAVALHVMPYLSSLGLSRNLAGLAAAGIPVVSIAGRLAFGTLGDRWPKRYTMALTCIMMGIGLLVFIYAGNFLWAGAFLVLYAPGLGGGLVLRGSMLREYFGRIALGKLLGVIMGFGAVGGMIGPTLAGWAFDASGDYRTLWIAFGLFTLTAAVVAWKTKPIKAASI